MSASTKRWLLNLTRVAVTAAAALLVLRMIQFYDVVRAGDRVGPVKEVRARGGSATVVWVEGPPSEHAPAEVRVEKPGFFSLFERTDKGLFLAMAAALLVPTGCMAGRWWLLLRGHGFAAPFGRIFFITYAGNFFNNFLPGSVGGDLTKAILAASGQERKAAVVGTIILDRAIGLGVMIVFGAACLTPFLRRFEDPRLAWVVYGLLGAMVLGYAAYFNRPLRGWLKEKLPFRATVTELDGVFRSARERKGLVGGASLLSLAGQASAILVIYGLARAMKIEGVELWQFFVFEPIIFMVTALPISVGGWGVQELLYQELFGRFAGVDPNQAIALSILYKLSTILMTIPGGVLFALGATRVRNPGV
jgi:hypothetical protein